uniref:Sugar phosphate isomerase/epimerase n=1 Tax=Desulfovibrio sp. U5L TaxID=596152 RepID=I2Q7K9_9BACT
MIQATALPLGVMQGRLLPKYQGRYQAHPAGYWRDEFSLAASLGLACIEWIVDTQDPWDNPLLLPDGPRSILAAARESGVAVNSVCADCFMEMPLHHPDPGAAAASAAILEALLPAVAAVGANCLVIPCVDASALAGRPQDADRLAAVLPPLAERARAAGVRLALETDLPPWEFTALLGRLPDSVGVNYDTGNSAALGFDPAEELAAYGLRLISVHIKDRLRGGLSVELGQGDTDFGGFFRALAPTEFAGPFILQAYRDDEGLAVFERQLAWLVAHMKDWLGGPGGMS